MSPPDPAQTTSALMSAAIPQELQGKTIQSAGPGVEDHGSASPSRGSVVIHQSGEHREFATFTHQYLRDFITLADQKAAFTLAISTAMLGYLETKPNSHAWFRNPPSWTFWDGIAGLSYVALVLSIVFCVLTVLPRLGGDAGGLIFWKAISRMKSSSDYAQKVLSASKSDLVEETLNHAYEMARICATKYSRLAAAIWLGSVGLVAAVFRLAFR